MPRPFDTSNPLLNIAKQQSLDDHENAVVREITDIQGSSLRARVAINTMLNCAILNTGAAVEPLGEEDFSIENIIAGYNSLDKSIALKNFHKEYALDTLLIASLEPRLAHVQCSWPSKSTTVATSSEERRLFGAEKDPAPRHSNRAHADSGLNSQRWRT